jgi:NAD(P)-dependent dehydrogenase (short-subunit alcohol dehydrogenase family)
VRLGLSARQARDHHLILVISVAAPTWSSTARGPAAHDRRQRGAALWLTQAVVPYLRERGSGSIVHVAARPGLEPTAGMATSAVSKAALVHLTRVLDLELRPLGIRVNAVAPQLLDTAKNRPYLTPELLAHAVAPEAVADLIVYLVSDASAPVSGAVVPAYGA